MATVVDLHTNELKKEFDAVYKRMVDGNIKHLIIVADVENEVECLEVSYLGCAPGHYAIGMLSTAQTLTMDEMYS